MLRSLFVGWIKEWLVATLPFQFLQTAWGQFNSLFFIPHALLAGPSRYIQNPSSLLPPWWYHATITSHLDSHDSLQPGLPAHTLSHHDLSSVHYKSDHVIFCVQHSGAPISHRLKAEVPTVALRAHHNLAPVTSLPPLCPLPVGCSSSTLGLLPPQGQTNAGSSDICKATTLTTLKSLLKCQLLNATYNPPIEAYDPLLLFTTYYIPFLSFISLHSTYHLLILEDIHNLLSMSLQCELPGGKDFGLFCSSRMYLYIVVDQQIFLNGWMNIGRNKGTRLWATKKVISQM